MVDTFYPLSITEQAMDIEQEDYYKSWYDLPSKQAPILNKKLKNTIWKQKL